jgi:hypothetical protein
VCSRTAHTSRPRRGVGGTLGYFLCAYAGPRRDVRPAGSVIPVAVSPVQPSPPLPHHTGHCGNIPVLLGRTGTRHHHNGHCATYGSRQQHPRTGPPWRQSTNCYTTALEVAPVRAHDAPRRLNRSGIRQDGRQLRSTVRHTSTRREIVQRACKLLHPWPIKRGVPPSRRGQTRDDG